MGLIYILLSDGQHAAYEEEQVRDMLAQQVITPETFFWKEGMADWRPLTELIESEDGIVAPPRRPADFVSWPQTAARPLESPPGQALLPGDEAKSSVKSQESKSNRRRKSRGQYYFRVNPVPLTIIIQSLTVLSLGAALFFIYQCLSIIYGWNVPPAGDPTAALLGMASDSNPSQAGVSSADQAFLFPFFYVLLGFHVLVECLFFFWIYFANKNCRNFTSNMTYTPGFAVGCFFIPILNLFRPYQVMQEIWKVSANPQAWLGKRDSMLVGCWFLALLSTIILLKGVFQIDYSDSDDPNVRALGYLIYLATVEVDLFFVQLTMLILVSVVTWRQVKWVRNGA
jgi:hypothetical protein